MKQATLDLIKNIDENTFIPPSTKNELFELFQLDTVADLRKVSRNFMKLYEILEHLDGQTSSATTEKAGIVKFGTETGNAIDAETWKQAIGQSLGGYVGKVENKEAGKWYINDLTDGKIYKCIQNHTSISFDITKFVDITNVGLSDKVENLFETYHIEIGNNVEVGKIFETNIKYPSSKPRILYSVHTGNDMPVDLRSGSKYSVSEIAVNLGVSKAGNLQYSVAKNTQPVDGRFIEVMFVF